MLDFGGGDTKADLIGAACDNAERQTPTKHSLNCESLDLARHAIDTSYNPQLGRIGDDSFLMTRGSCTLKT